MIFFSLQEQTMKKSDIKQITKDMLFGVEIECVAPYEFKEFGRLFNFYCRMYSPNSQMDYYDVANAYRNEGVPKFVWHMTGDSSIKRGKTKMVKRILKPGYRPGDKILVDALTCHNFKPMTFSSSGSELVSPVQTVSPNTVDSPHIVKLLPMSENGRRLASEDANNPNGEMYIAENGNEIFQFAPGGFNFYSQIEVKSAPLPLNKEGIREFLNIIKIIKMMGCKVNVSTGLHVHISHPDFNYSNYMYLLMNLNEDYIYKLFPRRRGNHYCNSKNDLIKVISDRITSGKTYDDELISNFKDFMDIAGLSNTSRYYGLNSLAYYEHRTIEFRYADGVLSESKAKKWITFLYRNYVKSFIVKRIEGTVGKARIVIDRESSEFTVNDKKFISYNVLSKPGAPIMDFLMYVISDDSIKNNERYSERFFRYLANNYTDPVSTEPVSANQDLYNKFVSTVCAVAENVKNNGNWNPDINWIKAAANIEKKMNTSEFTEFFAPAIEYIDMLNSFNGDSENVKEKILFVSRHDLNKNKSLIWPVEETIKHISNLKNLSLSTMNVIRNIAACEHEFLNSNSVFTNSDFATEFTSNKKLRDLLLARRNSSSLRMYIAAAFSSYIKHNAGNLDEKLVASLKSEFTKENVIPRSAESKGYLFDMEMMFVAPDLIDIDCIVDVFDNKVDRKFNDLLFKNTQYVFKGADNTMILKENITRGVGLLVDVLSKCNFADTVLPMLDSVKKNVSASGHRVVMLYAINQLLGTNGLVAPEKYMSAFNVIVNNKQRNFKRTNIYEHVLKNMFGSQSSDVDGDDLNTTNPRWESAIGGDSYVTITTTVMG